MVNKFLISNQGENIIKSLNNLKVNTFKTINITGSNTNPRFNKYTANKIKLNQDKITNTLNNETLLKNISELHWNICLLYTDLIKNIYENLHLVLDSNRYEFI